MLNVADLGTVVVGGDGTVNKANIDSGFALIVAKINEIIGKSTVSC